MSEIDMLLKPYETAIEALRSGKEVDEETRKTLSDIGAVGKALDTL
jgi:hypothetical protein